MTGEQSADPETTAALGDGRQVVLASPTARAVARLVDSAVHLLLASAGMWLIFLAMICSGCAWHQTDDGKWMLGVLLLVGWALYEPVMVAWRGQTLGKMACGITAVRVADGAVPGFGRAVVRWAVPAAVGVALSLAADAVTVAAPPAAAFAVSLTAWTPIYLTSFLDSGRRRGWHDRAAGTVVIACRPPLNADSRQPLPLMLDVNADDAQRRTKEGELHRWLLCIQTGHEDHTYAANSRSGN